MRIEKQKRIVEMIENKIGDIKYLYHPDDGIPGWLRPYGDIFVFEESNLVEKGKGYFLDTGKFQVETPKGFRFYEKQH